MNLTVYKGFDHTFLENIQKKSLVRGDIGTKTNVLQFDSVARKNLQKHCYLWMKESLYGLPMKNIR